MQKGNEKFYIEVILFNDSGIAERIIAFYARGKDNFDKYKSDFAQVLSTFKFTN